jgi:hypothetical protein
MKNIIYLFSLLILLSCHGKSGAPPNNMLSPDSFGIYKNDAEKFTLLYPKEWDTTKQDPRIIFSAVEKKSSNQSGFRENIVVYKVIVPNNITLDMLIKSAANAFAINYPSGTILDQGLKQNSQGLSYALFKVVVTQNEKIDTSTSVYFQRGQNIYVLTVANTDTTKKYSSSYSYIIDNFKFN